MKPILTTHVPFLARRSMAVAALDGKIYYFGGVGAGGTESIIDVSNDMWCFETHNMSWIEIVNNGCLPWPSPRRCVGFSSTKDGIYLWGGSGLDEATDIHRYTFFFSFR